jgi:hypothetical protein
LLLAVERSERHIAETAVQAFSQLDRRLGVVREKRKRERCAEEADNFASSHGDIVLNSRPTRH